MSNTITIKDSNGNIVCSVESTTTLTADTDINKTIQKIESYHKIQIPSQFRQALIEYNNEFIHAYGHDINCVPLNGDASKWRMFDEAGDKKYSSGIKDIAYKDFIVVEMNMGQMFKDVKNAINGQANIELVNRPCGEWLSVEEIVESVEKILEGGKKYATSI